MISYRLFKESRKTEDAEYEAYGIAAFDEIGEILSIAPDISPTKDKVMRLIRLCEEGQVSPDHLLGIAEDFIISDSY